MSTDGKRSDGFRIWLGLGALNGFLSVALGAFAAHGLKGRLEPYLLGVFDKGVDYQALHALALLATGLLSMQFPATAALGRAGVFFTAGIVLFSGSLYLLALTGVRSWGMVTPLGGVSFLVGWLLLAWAVLRLRNDACAD